MAIYTPLSGVGTQILTPGTDRLFVEVLTFGPGYSVGDAAPANYFKLGALRLGVQSAYFPAIYIDGADICVDLPNGVTTLAWSLFSGTSIKVTEATVVPPNSALQPWDRQPVVLNQMYVAALTPTGGPQIVWNYTVPAGLILRCVSIRCELKRSAVASASSNCYSIVTVNGLNWTYALLLSNTVGDGNVDEMQGGPMDFPAGTQIEALVANNDTGGAVITLAALNGYTFAA
jgi:hypothetical protein